MAWAYTIIVYVMAYSAGIGPSKPSISYNVSAGSSVVRCCGKIS